MPKIRSILSAANVKVALKLMLLHLLCIAKARLLVILECLKIFNIDQMGIEKTDCLWEDRLKIWWGDLVQMLSMQAQGACEDRPYDQYNHIFPGLAL